MVGAEIGVFDGAMSRELLERNELTLVMVDTWGSSNDTFTRSGDPLANLPPQKWLQVRERALQQTAFASNRRIVLMADSLRAASIIAFHSLDFAFIDSDHSYEAVSRDIAAWLPRIKPGGLLCGHDYGSPYPWTQGVTRAVDEFAQQQNLSVDLGEDHTWFIRLPDGRDQVPTRRPTRGEPDSLPNGPPNSRHCT
jgi:hypothetical protein